MPYLLILLLCLLSLTGSADELRNRLAGNPSPYLAMHAGDPVHWQSWDASVLERARRENKLIFISSGYFSCYWCHVMQRESYRDATIAALLNERFIPVKIDRELRPALDAHLIRFVEATRGSAGWPLNVFLTPEGYPLVGLSYARPKPFAGLLRELAQRWSTASGELSKVARKAGEELARSDSPPVDPPPLDGPRLIAGLKAMALRIGDDLEGGFGRQSRFPMTPQLAALLRLQARSPDPQLRAFLVLTLEQMAGNGLRDHIGGGFFRYTIDPAWQQPHFEKMLYTQAQLARLYLLAARVLDRADFRQIAADTLDFALRELRGRQGGFISSLSAVDPDGVEGGGYLWNDDRLAAALDERQRAFARARWRLQGDRPFDEGWLPVDGESALVVGRRLGLTAEQSAEFEAAVRARLLQARAPRAHPRDEKQLAGWNGLMLSALVDAAAALDAPRFREAAAEVAQFLLQRLWDGERLLRARDTRGAIGAAALADYAYVAAGLADWARLSGSEAARDRARELLTQAWRRFYRDDGWLTDDRLLLPGVARQRAIGDAPLPSPVAVLIGVTRELGDAALRRRARRALRLGGDAVGDAPLWYASRVALLFDDR